MSPDETVATRPSRVLRAVIYWTGTWIVLPPVRVVEETIYFLSRVPWIAWLLGREWFRLLRRHPIAALVLLIGLGTLLSTLGPEAKRLLERAENLRAVDRTSTTNTASPPKGAVRERKAPAPRSLLTVQERLDRLKGEYRALNDRMVWARTDEEKARWLAARNRVFAEQERLTREYEQIRSRTNAPGGRNAP